MQFEFGFYSSILLIFFVHMLVYSVLLYTKYRKQQLPSALWLSLFLLLAVLYIMPWMLGFAGWYNTQPYRDILFYVPFQHLFLIGPVIFFYIQSILNPAFRFTKKDYIHFLPGILYMLYCIVMFVYDAYIIKEYYFLKDGQDRDFDTWYQIAGFISMAMYFYVSITYYYRYKKIVSQVLSNATDFAFVWIRNFLIAFLTIIIARLIYTIFAIFVNMNYENTWWYFLSFSIICYYIAIAGYANAIYAKVFFKTNVFLPNNIIYVLPNKFIPELTYASEAYIDVPIEASYDKVDIAEDYSEWTQKITVLLKQDKIFKDAELSLVDMARKTNTNVSLLSKVINKGFGLNFNDLINMHRVDAVKDMLCNQEYKNQTLLSIAYECGFNSKTTFNRAFKKYTHISPQEFIKQNKH